METATLRSDAPQVAAPVAGQTFAVPFSPDPPEKLHAIVEAACAHRPWFSDYIWNSGAATIRASVIAYLVDAFNNGRCWEVWRGDTLVGILLVNELRPFLDAKCHFLFFDHRLKDKRQLCLNLMAWCFEKLPVEVLRVAVPTYARKLLGFIRHLGFRYEAEGREYSWPKNDPTGRKPIAPLDANAACLGSRRFRATFYQSQWYDELLLSLTKDEFQAFLSKE